MGPGHGLAWEGVSMGERTGLGRGDGSRSGDSSGIKGWVMWCCGRHGRAGAWVWLGIGSEVCGDGAARRRTAGRAVGDSRGGYRTGSGCRILPSGLHGAQLCWNVTPELTFRWREWQLCCSEGRVGRTWHGGEPTRGERWRQVGGTAGLSRHIRVRARAVGGMGVASEHHVGVAR